MGKRAQIEVQGLRQLRRRLADYGDAAVDDLIKAHQQGVDIVKADALPRVPVRSGALRETVRGSATKTGGRVRAGYKRVPYAGPIHFGWPARNIRPQPFFYDAVDARRKEVEAAFVDYLKRAKRQHRL